MLDCRFVWALRSGSAIQQIAASAVNLELGTSSF